MAVIHEWVVLKLGTGKRETRNRKSEMEMEMEMEMETEFGNGQSPWLWTAHAHGSHDRYMYIVHASTMQQMIMQATYMYIIMCMLHACNDNIGTRRL